MHKRTAELISYGSKLGFVNEGLDGRGHYKLRHPNGETVQVAATPGDYRGDDNCRAEFRRKAGVGNDGPNSGKHKKGVGKRKFTAAPLVATSDRARALREYIRNVSKAPRLNDQQKDALRKTKSELADLDAAARAEGY